MKEISIALWELTKDEVNRLPDGTIVLIYNSLTSDYKLEYSGKNCISRSKYASSSLKYFTFEAPKLLTTVYYVMGNDIGDEPYCSGGEVKCGPFLDLDEARDQEYKNVRRAHACRSTCLLWTLYRFRGNICMTEAENMRSKMKVNVDDDLLGKEVIFKTFYGEIQFGTVTRQYKDVTGKTRIFVRASDKVGSGCCLEDAIAKNRIFYNR